MDKNKNLSLFAVSFSQGFTSPKVPIALFRQGEKDLVFLLDSGSDKNIIDAEAVKEFEYTIQDHDNSSTTHLTGIGGTQKVEVCTMSFNCNDDVYTVNFLITDLKPAFTAIKNAHCIKLHGILGSEFLKENNIVLDFKTLSAYTKE